MGSSVTVKVLNGKKLSQIVQNQLKEQIAFSSGKAGRPPGLGVILVGDNEASKAYVASKEKSAAKIGMRTFDYKLPSDASFSDVAGVIQEFNNNSGVDGILLQLPLPPHLDAAALLELINPLKDADGLHPYNQGLLMKGQALLKPCTPLGCMLLLDLAYSEASLETQDFDLSAVKRSDLSGKHAIVIGRSILVGKPIAMMLLERNATVTMAHSKSPDIKALTRQADIVVAAVGRPGLVRKDWIKNGAVVIDVGINRLPSGKIGGDVAYDEVISECSAITPVPGGVGPMTIAMLLSNTYQSFNSKIGI
ncbi:MAG: bifunctional methylenetetrahydrofolate dehydrogenase/methenyltetrahydrofolate cyclohydrolase FolD [Deltaproteobacteria bacterium]|nr:bifunctional methylenetetrahydrofolate dehydrogenase/methenyltetrahydrofolate cyclohydrolase FolD [Deltaproteobacteria bacterium]